MKEKNPVPPNGEILLYQAPDGSARLDVRLVNESIWLSQNDMADLFGCTSENVIQHLKNIYESGELEAEATAKDFLVVRQEGSREVSRKIKFYNLDAIISVGYRVNSIRGTQFRIWATQRLREYIVKGFALDDERLKNPAVGDNQAPDYFSELLERIRDIRASERRMYLRVREIFSMAADYRIGFKETTQFFTFIQDKLHVAATGKTAAELICERADHQKTDMGLTNYPKDEIRKADVTVGKNYLNQNEINELNRIVTMWLDFAEDQVLRRKQIFLRDWSQKLDDFLRFNDREILTDHGTVSRESANRHANREYALFAASRRARKEVDGAKFLMNEFEVVAKKILRKKRS